MAVAGRYHLHPLHLELVHRYLGLDDMPLPLAVDSFVHTKQQLGEVARREYATMRSLGVLADDDVAAPLAEALRVLSKPSLWVDSTWFPEYGGQAVWRAVAVVTDRDRIVLGVQAPGRSERQGGALTVELHDAAALSHVLLPTLPPAPPGTLGAASVPESSFRESVEDPDERSNVMQSGLSASTRGRSGDRQLVLYRAIAAAPHVRAGQIAANSRDHHGRVSRSPVATWFDNVEPDGRYLYHTVRGNPELMYTATPADAPVLGSKIEDLVAAVR